MSWVNDLRLRLAREQELSAELVVEIICAEWGGERVYIPQRDRQVHVTQADTPKTIQQRYGVSRSTAYNWAGKWRR